AAVPRHTDEARFARCLDNELAPLDGDDIAGVANLEGIGPHTRLERAEPYLPLRNANGRERFLTAWRLAAILVGLHPEAGDHPFLPGRRFKNGDQLDVVGIERIGIEIGIDAGAERQALVLADAAFPLISGRFRREGRFFRALLAQGS